MNFPTTNCFPNPELYQVRLTAHPSDRSYCMRLSQELMGKLHLPFGKVSIIHPETNEALRIKSIVDTASLDLPPPTYIL